MTMTFVWNPLNHLFATCSIWKPEEATRHLKLTRAIRIKRATTPISDSCHPHTYRTRTMVQFTWKFKPSSLLPAGTQTRRRPDPASPALSWSVRACSLAFAGSQLGHVAAVLRSEANRPVGGLGHARRQRAFKYAGGARSTKVDRETLLLAS